ncbi:uncharacterized protein Art3 [Anabrus simplex]|uniref:uncharacterized protein Art3 n=1 Tax=Anabrus simplex TaxID=316456 RepID=UPI0035A35F70
MAEIGDMPALCANDNCDLNDDDDDDDDDSVDWNEVEEDDEHALCLFCSTTFVRIGDAIQHCKVDHNFDLSVLKARFEMDCYNFIKLVNYIRTHNVDASVVMNSNEPVWEKDEYMKPVVVDDPWLMYDFEGLELPSSARSSDDGRFHVANAENGCVTLSERHFAELQRTIQDLSAQVQEKDSIIQNMLVDMERMRQVTQNLVNDGQGEPDVEKSAKNIYLKDDEGYFNTYDHFGIHHEMLSDKVRTSSYHEALVKNAASLSGRTVLDLGCGTGILSLFAASVGAGHVIGIDKSNIIYSAMEIVRENNYHNKITLKRGMIEDTELESKVDVIVSEWMGYFLLFEGMLDSVIYARDKHLVKDGKLLPNRCSISLVGLADKERYQELIGFWSNVYGFNMNCMRQKVVYEPTVEVVPSDKVITSTSTLLELDLYTCTTESLDFSSEFTLHINEDDTLTALVGYFDVHFDLPHAVSFSTGPQATPTHWKQTVFFLPQPVPVKKGESISGKLICQRQIKDVRSLTVTIILSGKRYKYILS